MRQWITCISVGIYEPALVRGKRYEVIALDEHKRQVRVRGENARTRWFPVGCFDMDGKPVSTLVRW